MQSTNECILPRRLVDLGFDPESLEISEQRLKKSEKIFQWKFCENCSAAGENIQENILRKFLMLIFFYLVFRFLNLIFASGMTTAPFIVNKALRVMMITNVWYLRA